MYALARGTRRSGEILDVVRSFLAAGFPVAFGLPVPTSISRSAEISYRPAFDSVLSGQALLAVGYDDRWLSSSRGGAAGPQFLGRRLGRPRLRLGSVRVCRRAPGGRFLDDAATRLVGIRRIHAAHGGQILKVRGDGFVAVVAQFSQRALR